MKKALKIFIVLALFLGIGSNISNVNAATKYSATVNTKILNVREKTSDKSKKVGTLKKGTKVTVYSKTKSGWSQIVYKKKKAYVATKYLKFAPSTKKVSYLRNKNKIYVYDDANRGTFTEKYVTTKDDWSIWNTYLYNGKDVLWQKKEKEDSKGLYSKYDKDVKTLLQYPIKLGKSWSYKSDGDTYTIKITSLNKTIKTKAGTFKNVLELTITNKKKTFQEKDYYAPGNGLIKYYYDDKEYGSNEYELIKINNK
ncbi:SH3 domain-containing protein [Niallia nealsonii]|nr:SH3 domain-containing protein [Niallia nealsonii]